MSLINFKLRPNRGIYGINIQKYLKLHFICLCVACAFLRFHFLSQTFSIVVVVPAALTANYILM